MWLTLITRYWQYAVIAVLGVALSVSMTKLKDARNAEQACRIEFKVALDQASAARKEVELRSETAISSLREDHAIHVKEVEKNAWKNFIARYGIPSCRLPNAVPTGPNPPDITLSPAEADAGAEGQMAFVRDCAADAAAILEWQAFAIYNHLPIAKD